MRFSARIRSDILIVNVMLRVRLQGEREHKYFLRIFI